MWFVLVGVLLISLIIGVVGSRAAKHRQESPRIPASVVNINQASFSELNALPGITDSTAQAIIDGRPYRSVDELIRVYGIGPKTLERVRPYVVVEVKTAD
jgi:competence protein ComEA